MLFGRGAYLNSPYQDVSGSGATFVYGDAPYANDINSNSNSVTNMIGVEFRYYTSDKFAIRVSGGAILRNTPYVINTPGVNITELYDDYSNSDYESFDDYWDYYNSNVIPAYGQVDATEEAEVNFSIGGEFLFKTKNERLFPYLGFALPFDYARRSVFTPQTIDQNGNVTIHDTGARHIEITALSVQAVAGADYYIAKDLFFGFEVKPVNYTYAYSINSPAPELHNLEAENSTVSFFAQFNFKLGFKF
jgi:hypothetical protein